MVGENERKNRSSEGSIDNSKGGMMGEGFCTRSPLLEVVAVLDSARVQFRYRDVFLED
jgi:hypothetical protein